LVQTVAFWGRISRRKSHQRRPADRNKDQNPTARRSTLAQSPHLDYCISEQHLYGATVDHYEIEDTSEWLGNPTQLETVKHYASMLEDDVQNLKRQLKAAQENISTLVDMNDQLSADLEKKRIWMANLEAETTDQLSQIHSLTRILDQKEVVIRELQALMLNHRRA
jgi:predicted outer membrane protein